MALMTMQLQIANISRKLDAITTNSVPNAVAFASSVLIRLFFASAVYHLFANAL